MKNKIILQIPKTINDKIKYTCSFRTEKEWAGVMFYEKKEEHVFIIRDFYPLIYGSEATVETTEIEEKEGNDYRMKTFGKNSFNIYTGRIHSHNNMNVFFSGTDQKDLETFSKSGVTISIVTNNKNEYYGKIGFPIKHPLTDKIVIYSTEINIEVLDDVIIDSDLENRIKELIKKSKKSTIIIQPELYPIDDGNYLKNYYFNRTEETKNSEDINDLEDIEFYIFDYNDSHLTLSGFIKDYGSINSSFYFKNYNYIKSCVIYNKKLKEVMKKLLKSVNNTKIITTNIIEEEALFNICMFNMDLLSFVTNYINNISDKGLRNHLCKYFEFNGVEIIKN